MFKRLCFLFTVFLVNSMCCSAVNGAEGSVEEHPQIFTNQDIEKYKGPSEAKTSDARAVSKEDAEKAQNDKNQSIWEDQEKEYWCKKASAYKKKIKKADDDVKETEGEIVQGSSKGSHGGKKTSQLQKKLEKSRKKVEYAEAGLGELEDEAHRKGVPPGWPRCQK
jgi:chromosome segregation ATPase